jgi:hypothetical protein
MISINGPIAQERWALVINQSKFYGITRASYDAAIANRGTASNCTETPAG